MVCGLRFVVCCYRHFIFTQHWWRRTLVQDNYIELLRQKNAVLIKGIRIAEAQPKTTNYKQQTLIA